MKNNKGIGLVGVLIIIGAVLVAGIAFLVGKNYKEKNNFPEEKCGFNGELCKDTNTQNNNTQTNCLPTTSPWVKIISPNGVEIYYKNSAINLKWEFCNVPPTVHMGAELVDINNPQGGKALLCEGGASTWGPECLNDGEQTFGTVELKPGKYKVKIFSKEGVPVSDTSDNSFTILGENAPNNQPHESGNDLNGQHLGYIKSVSFNNGDYSMKIDYVQWISPCPGELGEFECPNGYKIVNSNSLLRTFPISNNITVTSLTEPGAGLYNNGPQQISLNSFHNLFKSNTLWTDSIPFWITIKNGVVTEIAEQYVP